MLKNYFKLAYRNLLKNKLSSFINIVGLSVAIGCSIVFFLMLDLEYTSDRFHENASNIFMVVYSLEGDQSAQRWGDSPQPLGQALESEFPQVKRAVRITDKSSTVRYKDQVFNESIRFVDPGFLDMFTFPLKWGNRPTSAQKNGLVLSEEMAEKYFGKENPVGEQVVITFNNVNQDTYFVLGVAEKFPHNASFSFNILASFEKFLDISEKTVDDWKTFIRATFIQVNDPNDLSAISAQMDKYTKRHNVANVDRPIALFAFEPLPTLSWESQEIERSISSGSTPQALIMLFVIGLFLLLQACFNYVNIALASGSRRLKEISIRKVVGCQRIQLVFQFLGENLLMCFLALIGGLALTEFIFIPGLMEITGSPDKMTLLDFFTSMHLWMFFVLIVLLTGIGAGAYPALTISRLQPVSIMKGKLKLSGKKRFTSFLLAFQFGIAFLILCLLVAFLQNNQYQQRRDWGYNQEHVINIRLEKGNQFEILKNAVDSNLNVIQTAGTGNLIGRSESQAVVEVEAIKHEVIRFDVGFNYLETLGIRLKEGRFFDPVLSTDRDSALVVNEQFVQDMGWEHAVDQPVRYENRSYTVIGVVEDFHYDFFFEEIQPVLIRLAPEEALNYLVARVNAGTGTQSAAALKGIWQKLFPDSAYGIVFQDSVFEQAYRNNVTITKIFLATAVITLVISCMGLFGLVTLMISKRTKELSIHKVLGASIIQIASLITKRFVILLGASILLALPGGYFFLNALLDGVYKYHMPLSALPFVLAAVIVLLTAFLTIVTQVYKATVRDPIEAIRYE